MRILALGFLAGTLLVQNVDTLDGLAVAGGLGVALAMGLRAALARVSDADEAGPRWVGIALTVLAALAAGVGWTAWRAEVRLSDELAGTLESVELTLQGRVDGLPRASGPGWRFDFAVEPETPGVPGLVQLGWRPE